MYAIYNIEDKKYIQEETDLSTELHTKLFTTEDGAYEYQEFLDILDDFHEIRPVELKVKEM